MEPDRILTRGASVSLVMRIAGVVIAYLANLLLARWMGIAGYGQYVFALGVAAPLAIASGFGLDRIAVKFLPTYVAHDEPAKIRGLFGWSRRTLLVTSLATAGFVAVVALLASDLVPGDIRPSILLACALVPFLAFAKLNSSILLGFKKVGPATMHDVIRPVVLILAAGALMLAAAPLGVEQAVLALGVALAVVLAAQSLAIDRASPPMVGESAPVREIPLWKSAIRALFAIQVLQILMSKLDVILLGAMTDVESVAIYGVARRIAVLIGFSEVAVAMIAQPVLAELQSLGETERLQRAVQIAAHISLWPTVIAGVLVGTSSDFVLGMFGAEFVAGSPVLWILIVAQLLHAMVSPAFILLTFTGYHDVSARQTGIVFAVSLIFLAVGISWMGMIGAALASVASALLWNGILHVSVWRRLRIISLPIIGIGRKKRGA